MRTLKNVPATAEQLKILSKNSLSVEIIRGAAGSGKTTTGLLRLRSLVGVFLGRRKRANSSDPVRILVLTYNRTLRGYISELASGQFNTDDVELEISTFAKWALDKFHSKVNIIDQGEKSRRINSFGRSIPLASSFLLQEVEYVMGRFLSDNLTDYLTVRRDGRGAMPRVEKALRKRILDEVINPYQVSIDQDELWDWNDFAVYFASNKAPVEYDIVVVDEAQDFSANELRAIINQQASSSSITFILDTAQRIYARGYTWSEIGVSVRPEQVHRLERNYRNTRQIAALASSLIDGVPVDDDATMPDFSKSDRNGDVPLLLNGLYRCQVEYALDYIVDNVDLLNESVVFLHPLGWFSYLKKKLEERRLQYVELTRKPDWPKGPGNIGLCTFHSAKGLEFDHVISLGLNAKVTPHGGEDEDDSLQTLRRLLAMGIGRAKKNVILGCKQDEKSVLIDYIDPATYREVLL